MKSESSTTRKIGAALISTALIVAAAAMIVCAADVLMLIFLGLLFGVFLTHCTGKAGNYLPLSDSVNLAIVSVSLFVVMASTLFGIGVSIDDQLEKASQKLDGSVAKVEKWLKDHPTVFATVKKIPFSKELFPDGNSAKDISPTEDNKPPSAANAKDVTEKGQEQGQEQGSKDRKSDSGGSDESDNSFKLNDSTGRIVQQSAGRVFGALQKTVSTSFGLLANLGIIFFIGLFLAIDPELYRDGIVRLFPQKRRQRLAEVLDMMGGAMFSWIIGRFFSMLLTGVGTAIALAILGVPMPVTIGIATGLLAFIPNIGSIIALVLASLMSLTQGPMTVVWVIVAYGAIQMVESNVITPMIQQYQTSIPPALLLSFQLIFGVLNGFLGLTIATPLLAAILPMVRELWIKDVLESDSEKENQTCEEAS